MKHEWFDEAVRLAGEARAGSADALEKLLELCRPHVMACLRTRLREADPADHEDLTQSVMQTVVEKLSTLRKLKSFPYWLLSVTKGKALNLVRDNPPHRHDSLDAPLASDTPSAEDVLLRKNLSRALRRCIELLAERQRQMLMLHYYHGFKVREIADLLGVKTGTVTPTLRQARIRLKECLQGGERV